MATLREAHGWAVVATGAAVAYTAFVFRLLHLAPETLVAPSVTLSLALPAPLDDQVFLIALAGVVVGAVGLRMSLRYFFFQGDGWPMYAAAVLLLAAGTLHLFQIPGETNRDYILFLTAVAVLEWTSLPLLSYRSAPWLSAVAVLALLAAFLTTAHPALPQPFASAADPWGLLAMAARFMEVAAAGASGVLLVLLRHVPPASERTNVLA